MFFKGKKLDLEEKLRKNMKVERFLKEEEEVEYISYGGSRFKINIYYIYFTILFIFWIFYTLILMVSNDKIEGFTFYGVMSIIMLLSIIYWNIRIYRMLRIIQKREKLVFTNERLILFIGDRTTVGIPYKNITDISYDERICFTSSCEIDIEKEVWPSCSVLKSKDIDIIKEKLNKKISGNLQPTKELQGNDFNERN